MTLDKKRRVPAAGSVIVAFPKPQHAHEKKRSSGKLVRKGSRAGIGQRESEPTTPSAAEDTVTSTRRSQKGETGWIGSSRATYLGRGAKYLRVNLANSVSRNSSQKREMSPYSSPGQEGGVQSHRNDMQEGLSAAKMQLDYTEIDSHSKLVRASYDSERTFHSRPKEKHV